MSSETAQVELLTAPEQYGSRMMCPITKLIIPKTPADNLRWRRDLMRAADTSDSTRRQLIAASSKSPLFWLNAFGWTYRPKMTTDTGVEIALTGNQTHVPFITWKVQDEAILTLKDCVEQGKDGLINKSRDMGASWLGVALIQWFWQFRGNVSFLELSRKEALVDRRGSLDSLFEKHRYLLNWQPNWLQPRNVRDTYMHLENRDNGSVIDGESTNKDAGQAARSTAVLLDEFARVQNDEAIDLATADTTACRIFNSTPGAPNAQFTKIYRQRRAVIIELPWWRHPEKGRGAHQVVDSESGKVLWTSPWREQQKERRSKRDVAQNIDMEHGRVGDMIFDADEIEKHRTAFAREPDRVGRLVFNSDIPDSEKRATIRKFSRNLSSDALLETVRFSDKGGTMPWRLWLDLVDDRPPQDDRYVFGIDVSGGTGSSNSVCTVRSQRHGRIVAKFWDAYTPPEAFAEQVAYAAIWFGGRKAPYIVFEKNGPGMQFGRKLLSLSYSAIYYQRVDSTKTNDKTKRWGWHSSNQRKEMLIGEYREALKSGHTINPSNESLDEALDYVYDDSGKMVPGTSRREEGGATATHGDHVVADALTVLGSADLPSETGAPEPKRVTGGSFADRRRMARRKRSREKAAWEG